MGLNRITTDWDLSKNTTMAVGDTLTKSYTDPSGASVNVFITRLSEPFFWAVSEATTRGNSVQYGSRRRYGSLLRLNMANVNYLGAVTAAGNVRVSGNVTVNGNDVSPTGWPNCGAANNMPGAVISPTATTTVNGSVSVSGNPPFTTSASAADSNTYFSYGSATYTSLASMANVTLPAGTYNGMGPVLSGGACLKSSQLNWGDPIRHSPAAACETYFPIVHVTGNLSVSNGTGQGILLVDGDLTKAGNFSYYGLVIVRGTIRSSGSSNGVTGAEMAASVDEGDAVTLSGSTTIQYSSCVLLNALAASSYPALAKQRAWVNLY
jgi:hypothetical protein